MSTDREADTKAKALGVAREMYGRVAYTHKTHEKDREICSRKARREKWTNVVIVGLTTIAAVAGAVFNDRCMFVVTSVLGAFGTAFVVYQLSFNACKMESDHRNAAKKLLSLRERYLMLIMKMMIDKSSLAELYSDLHALQVETSIVYENAPDTSAEAYAMAGSGLSECEELTFSEEEIDRLLPNSLRLAVVSTGPEAGDATADIDQPKLVQPS